MSEPVLLVIDAGTARMKAALIDLNGRLIDFAASDLEVLRPFDGAAEADMNVTWSVFCSLTRSLAGRNPETWFSIKGLGISGQGDGFWPINQAGQPVRNAILWNDTRVKRLDLEDPQAVEKFCIDHSVTQLFPGAWHILLKWVRLHEPEKAAEIRSILHCKDWLNFKLSGKVMSDYSDASTALLNVIKAEYEYELLNRLGLPGAEELFPPLQRSTDIVGEVTKAASVESAIPAGVPVITGAIDVAAMAAGANAVEPGDALSIIGTTLCNEVVLRKEQVDHSDTRGSTLFHLMPDLYLRLMANSAGASTLDWARQILVPGEPFEEIEKGLQSVPPGSEGVLYHPYLYGERAPFRNPYACGGFLGLTHHHTRFHMLRAAYEGLAMSLRDCFEFLPSVDRLINVVGGASASDTLCQICADALGKPLKRSNIKELGLYGIARGVRMGLGYSAEFPELEKVFSVQIFEPDKRRHEKYEQLYQLFLESRASVEPYWNERETFLRNF